MLILFLRAEKQYFIRANTNIGLNESLSKTNKKTFSTAKTLFFFDNKLGLCLRQLLPPWGLY